MKPIQFTILFSAFILISALIRVVLAYRQVRHVSRCADQVPNAFKDRITLEEHKKAAAYTITKTQFSLVDLLLNVGVLLALTLLGGLNILDHWLRLHMSPGIWQQTVLILLVTFLSSIIDIPLAAWRQFKIEADFGFNRMTPKLFIADLFKGWVLGAVIGIPLIACILWLMNTVSYWWLGAWALMTVFSLAIQALYPVLIAPIFNKFTPLPEGATRERVHALLARTGFSSKGIFTIDGSKRSGHGNAYFAGMGKAKRIVFFDTLLTGLNDDQIEAILAHELGHFARKHIIKRMIISFVLSFVGFAVLGYLANQLWFYIGLGVHPHLIAAENNALALILFSMCSSVFTFPVAPLGSWFSRKHEYEADAFAAQHSEANALISALVSLYKENSSTLTPDALHSLFYDSHPPASLRIAHLQKYCRL